MAVSPLLSGIVGDMRRLINDRSVNPQFSASEILRRVAISYDRVAEDIFTTSRQPVYVEMVLRLGKDKREYLLPTGIGHVVELMLITSRTGASTPTLHDYAVVWLVHCYGQQHAAGRGWTWNPPFLTFDSAPTVDNLYLLVTFIPRAVDYMHEGAIATWEAVNAGFASSFTISVTSGASGNFKLWFSGETTADISVSASAGTVETGLEALTSIVDVTVTGAAGGPWTVTMINPAAPVMPFKVQTQPVVGTVSVSANSPVAATTVLLDSTPYLGDYDPRPNAFVGGAFRLLSGGTPFGHRAFSWQERMIIGYDVAVGKITLSSPFDFDPHSAGTYEITPMVDDRLFELAKLDAAAYIFGTRGNNERVGALQGQYDKMRVTYRRQVGDSNRAVPLSAPPKFSSKQRVYEGLQPGEIAITGGTPQFAGDRILF